jgi:hypothetical protein
VGDDNIRPGGGGGGGWLSTGESEKVELAMTVFVSSPWSTRGPGHRRPPTSGGGAGPRRQPPPPLAQTALFYLASSEVSSEDRDSSVVLLLGRFGSSRSTPAPGRRTRGRGGCRGRRRQGRRQLGWSAPVVPQPARRPVCCNMRPCAPPPPTQAHRRKQPQLESAPRVLVLALQSCIANCQLPAASRNRQL